MLDKLADLESNSYRSSKVNILRNKDWIYSQLSKLVFQNYTRLALL